MGNANGREEDDGSTNMNINTNNNVEVGRIISSESMANSPPESPGLSRSPLMFAPQLPVAPLQKDDGTLFHKDVWQTERTGAVDRPPEKGIPTVITWSLGGNNVAVEGSWDNWTSRKILRRSGKDHAVLLVLPSGIYHYRFIVDGEMRYTPELPHVSSEMGLVCNVLNVDRLRRYNPPSHETEVQKRQRPPSPPLDAQRASTSSSSGETLVSNSQEHDTSSGVLDTPDRVGSVVPNINPQSNNLHDSWSRRPRRNILPQCNYDSSCVEEDTSLEHPDSFIDADLIRRFHPALLEKHPRNSHS